MLLKLNAKNLNLLKNHVHRCFHKSKTNLTLQVEADLQNEGKSLLFPGSTAKFTSELRIASGKDVPKIPIYRLIDETGKLINENQKLEVDEELAVKMYTTMMKQNLMDTILYQSQRQGWISFYMTSYGEEGTQIGSASALEDTDLVYGQYREAGVLTWRGFTFTDFMDQCFSNDGDHGRGRMMPVHFGSKKLNFITISSPIATQMPQAVGSAYAFKLAGNKRCVIVYFGEGASSEGDAHAAFNFAVTLECPLIFFCRNNGFSISTPVNEQYRGDAIAGRAVGYGLPALRVDGNDVFAVRNATLYAREYCLRKNTGVVIEALTYRVGHHSTSDDSTAYRPKEEVEKWEKLNNPINRLRFFMERRNWWDDEKQISFQKKCKEEIMKAFKEAKNKMKPELIDMFTDVYYEMPDHLQEQWSSLKDHLEKYGEHYPLAAHKK